MKEELTSKMHGEFTVNNETDIKHRVWALLSEQARTGRPLPALAVSYGLTTHQIDTHDESYFQLDR